MPGGEQPEKLSVAEVCRRCHEETARYRRGEPHDDAFCFEVFRRAVVERNEACWRELNDVYHDLVLGWCRAAGAAGSHDLDEVASQTWVKFWRSYTPEKLAAASSTPAVLLYLKMCARSVVFDEARGRANAASLDNMPFKPVDPDPQPGQLQADQATRAAFWELINRHLHDERERILLHLAYELRMRSAQIQAQRPDLFPSVGDVYRITRNVIDRLKRSQDLKRWFETEGL
jgi:hypothetical protein